MLRPNVILSDNEGAVLKYQCALNGMTIKDYVTKLIIKDLNDKQPALMKSNAQQK